MTPEERLAELEKENAALRAALEKALRELEEWKRGFRERGKRRSSRPEGKRPATGRPTGRRAGHAGAQREVPRRIDRTVHYAPPEYCDCGGPVEPTDAARRTLVEDIPPVRVEVVEHVAQVGRCRCCGQEVWEPLPGDTRQDRSIARTQVGPNATAMTVSLRFDHHVSLAGIATFLGVWLGLRITAGAVAGNSVITVRLSPAANGSEHDAILRLLAHCNRLHLTLPGDAARRPIRFYAQIS